MRGADHDDGRLMAFLVRQEDRLSVEDLPDFSLADAVLRSLTLVPLVNLKIVYPHGC